MKIAHLGLYAKLTIPQHHSDLALVHVKPHKTKKSAQHTWRTLHANWIRTIRQFVIALRGLFLTLIIWQTKQNVSASVILLCQIRNATTATSAHLEKKPAGESRTIRVTFLRISEKKYHIFLSSSLVLPDAYQLARRTPAAKVPPAKHIKGLETTLKMKQGHAYVNMESFLCRRTLALSLDVLFQCSRVWQSPQLSMVLEILFVEHMEDPVQPQQTVAQYWTSVRTKTWASFAKQRMYFQHHPWDLLWSLVRAFQVILTLNNEVWVQNSYFPRGLNAW